MTAPLVPRPSPFQHFGEWFEAARMTDPQPEAAALATVGADGQPSNRLVLVRQWDVRGFEVFTNLRSRKAQEIGEQPRVALTFHWKGAGPARGGRQVRIEGVAEPVSAAESDAYWAARPRGSRISAIASDQSEPIESREALLAKRDALEQRHAEGEDVPRPAHWGGYRIVPLRVEFWQHEDDRYHRRLLYIRSRAGAPWSTAILQP
ncbi:MAG: pyridoxamine 5'-phosphate oxidase [Dehalococcoidia bacterium]|nr:pyridoxamine 5'-phosphate oxidase [Dehalococcoidia bacterium]